MNALLARLDKGEDFAEVARSGLRGIRAPRRAGASFPAGSCSASCRRTSSQQVKKLAKGQRTGPIPQRTGTYVFQVFDLRPRGEHHPFKGTRPT